MKKIICAVAACGILGGCATPAKNIAPAYVSSVGYNNMGCGAIAAEAQAISAAAVRANGQQNAKATGDAVAMGVALVVFWPAVFFIGGDGASAAEVSRLKGEMQAIETAARRRGCKIGFRAS